MLLGDGEAHLFALVAALVVEFLQRVCVGLVVLVAVAEDIDGGEDGAAQ